MISYFSTYDNRIETFHKMKCCLAALEIHILHISVLIKPGEGMYLLPRLLSKVTESRLELCFVLLTDPICSSDWVLKGFYCPISLAFSKLNIFCQFLKK